MCGATILVGHGYPFGKANILRHALFLHSRFNLWFIDFRGGFKFHVQRVKNGAMAHRLPGAWRSSDMFSGAY